jgi:hypothetical protein
MVGGDPRDAVQCFPPCGPGIDRSGLSRDVASLRHWLNPSMADSAILIRADRIPPGSLRARFTRQIARKDEGRIDMTGKIALADGADLYGFDFAAQPSLDPRQIRELAACRSLAWRARYCWNQQSAAMAAR